MEEDYTEPEIYSIGEVAPIKYEKIIHSLALDLYDQAKSSGGITEFIILALGIFYCICGIRFKRISQVTILLISMFSLFVHYSAKLAFIIHPVDLFIKNIISAQLASQLPKGENMAGIIACSIIATCLVLSMLSWAHLISLGFVSYFIYVTLEPIFINNFKSNAQVICLICTAIITFFIYYIKSYAINIITGLIICFIGTCIIFSFIPKEFANFELFYKKMVNLDPVVLTNWLLYAVIATTVLSFCMQITGFKGI